MNIVKKIFHNFYISIKMIGIMWQTDKPYLFYVLLDIIVYSGIPLINLLMVQKSIEMMETKTEFRVFVMVMVTLIVISLILKCLHNYFNYKRDLHSNVISLALYKKLFEKTLSIDYEMLLDKGGISAYTAIRMGDFDKWGCPICGSDYSYSSMSGGGAADVTCGECGHEYILVSDSLDEVPFKAGKGEMSAGTVFIIDHPRKGIEKHKYKAPDLRPDCDGEYWSPRGIGYDLSGFVKSKEAGERIVAMFEKALGKKPETWLDFREREPNWIQVKVQGSEADLEKLYELTKETGIITYDIILSVIKK